jgi:hypothetical protein
LGLPNLKEAKTAYPNLPPALPPSDSWCGLRRYAREAEVDLARRARLVVNDEKIRVRHPASQQAGNVWSVLVQFVEQGTDVGLGIEEEGK